VETVVLDQAHQLIIDVVVTVVLVVGFQETQFLQHKLVVQQFNLVNQVVQVLLVLDLQVVVDVKQETQIQVVVTQVVAEVVVLAQ
tara:strand:+ start:20 stop:274 length:255 start_codon:yes stop_codon:yes gene_type:complete